MSEPPEYAGRAALLVAIGRFIYDCSPQREAIPMDDVYDAFRSEEVSAVDYAVKKMETHDLLSLQLKGPIIRPLGHGKACSEQNCIAEVVLGRDYISKKFSAAVAHIIVSDAQGEESGGTGFLCADFPNQIITAAHVLDGRTVKKIRTILGEEIAFTGNTITIGRDGLDLAALQCHMPAGIEPIRIEWKPSALAAGSELTVFGYPKIAGHLPSLYQSSAELHSIAEKYSSPRTSLIISSVTHPGCSGGPVLDLRGFAIGVIEQENALEQKAGTSAYFSATPAYYLRELFW
jgi:S1-C subfamily serine protease